MNKRYATYGLLLTAALLYLNLSGTVLFPDSTRRAEARSARDTTGAYRTHFHGGK
jgi:hypothetical protein